MQACAPLPRAPASPAPSWTRRHGLLVSASSSQAFRISACSAALQIRALAILRPLPLKPEGIGIRSPGLDVLRSERGHRRCLVKPYKSVELLRQRDIGIMALELGVGP